MRLKQQIDAMQTRLASQWFEVLKAGRPEDITAFNDWCRESPLHIREFLEVAFVERALSEHAFGQEDESERLLALLRQASVTNAVAQLSPLQPVREHSRPRRNWFPGFVFAATLAAFSIGLMVLWEWRRPEQEFSTAVGEQRTVKLVDASVVTLNTNSDIRIAFEPHVRDIELVHGEAIFKVAHDDRRPFRVHMKAGTVQAVGTQFNVYDREGGTDISVLEGRVRLIARNSAASATSRTEELIAGEEARIGVDGTIQRVKQPDVARATAWSNRRLKFDNASLEEMVEEFNRYQRDTRLRMEGVAPQSHHYSGIFDPDAPEAFAKFLAREPDLRVDIGESEIVIRPRIVNE